MSYSISGSCSPAAVAGENHGIEENFPASMQMPMATFSVRVAAAGDKRIIGSPAWLRSSSFLEWCIATDRNTICLDRPGGQVALAIREREAGARKRRRDMFNSRKLRQERHPQRLPGSAAQGNSDGLRPTYPSHSRLACFKPQLTGRLPSEISFAPIIPKPFVARNGPSFLILSITGINF